MPGGLPKSRSWAVSRWGWGWTVRAPEPLRKPVSLARESGERMLAVPGVYGCPCCVFLSSLSPHYTPAALAVCNYKAASWAGRQEARRSRGSRAGPRVGRRKRSGSTAPEARLRARLSARCARGLFTPPPGGGASPSSAPRVSHAWTGFNAIRKTTDVKGGKWPKWVMDFSLETFKATRKWKNTFSVLKETLNENSVSSLKKKKKKSP